MFWGVLGLNQVIVFHQCTCVDLGGFENLGKGEQTVQRTQGRFTDICVLHVELLLLKFFIVLIVILQSPCIITAITKDPVDSIPSTNPVCQRVFCGGEQ